MTTRLTLISKILSETRPVVTRALGEAEAERRFQAVMDIAASVRPRVLVYGTYNAGKSTLINALCGEAVAEVQDVPTTDRVAAYRWGEAELLDTPGINAPQEHEDITAEALERVLLVLFVVRQGAQDVDDLYRRLFELLRTGKRIFIVFNHEAPDQDTLRLLVTRLDDLLLLRAAQYGADPEWVAEMPVFPVNLATAWRARERGSEKLLAHSRLPELEERVRRWLTDQLTDDRRLAAVARHVESVWIEPALLHLDREEKDPVFDELQRRRQALLAERGHTQAQLVDEISRGVRGQRSAVREIIIRFARDGTEALDALQDQIEALFEPVVAEIGGHLAKTLEQAEELNVDLMVRLDTLGTAAGKEWSLPDPVKATIRRTVTDKAILKEVLLTLRRIKIPFFKGRWEKTLNGWAGRAAWVMQIAISAYEMWSATKAQEEANRREQKFVTEAARATNEVLEQVETSIRKEVISILNKVYKEPIATVDAALEEIKTGREQQERDVITLKQALRELQEMYEI